MSSPAWIEPATGAEARSVRRWARRVAMGIAARKLILLVGMIIAVFFFAAMLREVITPAGDCFDFCDDGRPNDLIDFID